jgi:hypothetical protein
LPVSLKRSVAIPVPGIGLNRWSWYLNVYLPPKLSVAVPVILVETL